jgi:hypothetical protein
LTQRRKAAKECREENDEIREIHESQRRPDDFLGNGPADGFEELDGGKGLGN